MPLRTVSIFEHVMTDDVRIERDHAPPIGGHRLFQQNPPKAVLSSSPEYGHSTARYDGILGFQITPLRPFPRYMPRKMPI